MLLSAFIICCAIVVDAESPVNSYSLTGSNNNEYDGYTKAVINNGHFGSKDTYQNGGNFYSTGDTSHILSNHITSHSSINGDNQENIRSNTRDSYNKYSVNDHGNEYTGYKTYENTDSNSYTLSTQASIPLGGYSDSNNREAVLNAYSSGSIKDSGFAQYIAGSNSNGQRVSPYPEYSRSPVLENYSESTAESSVQGHHVPSGIPNYSENNHVYSPYLSSGLTSQYTFGKQKDSPFNLKGSNKYNDMYSIPVETRFTRGSMGQMNHNHDVPLYLSGSGSNNYLSKPYGSGSYSSGKPYKYGYKSRYAPNNGVTYLSRDRDSYYAPYGKGTGKVIIIKDNRPNYFGGHTYSDEPYTSSNAGIAGYKSNSAGFMNAGGYLTSSNLDGYSGISNNYDDGPSMPRRYRNSGGHMFVQRNMYA